METTIQECPTCHQTRFYGVVCTNCGWRPPCKVCGEPIKRGRMDKVTCSDKCRQRDYLKRQGAGHAGIVDRLADLPEDHLRSVLQQAMLLRAKKHNENRPPEDHLHGGRLRVRWGVSPRNA